MAALQAGAMLGGVAFAGLLGDRVSLIPLIAVQGAVHVVGGGLVWASFRTERVTADPL